MRWCLGFRLDRLGAIKLFVMYVVCAVKQAPVRTAW